MYRSSDEYDRMKKLAIAIIEDYGITADDYPLDVKALCSKMKINVVPYSAYEDEGVDLLLKKSIDGFNIPRSTAQEAVIMINDKYGTHLSPARISQTLGHEIKHIVEEDTDDSEDDLCDYFSKYLRCPIPLVLYMGIVSSLELISRFGISFEQATYVLSNIINRRAKYGDSFFEFEVELLRQLLGDSFDDSGVETIEKE